MTPDQLRLRSPAVYLGAFALMCLAGCASFSNADAESADELLNLVEEEEGTKLTGMYTMPVGLQAKQIESVSLVRNLAGTGSDPPPSSQRTLIISEMQARRVDKPSQVLADPNTSLVFVQGVLPPGIQKGERFDLTVSLPRQSETTSLEGGYLMASRLKEIAAVNNRIKAGHVFGAGQGPLLTESSLGNSTDPVLKTRARIPGGGVASKSRNLGLAISEDHKSIQLAMHISQSLNRRFHTFANGKKEGVANPTRDNYIELAIASRYKNNLKRYIHVIGAIAVDESDADRQVRLELLRRQLLEEPTTTAMAAIRLEAIGKEAIPVLKEALSSPDPDVRFNAAEVLAYLDDPEAAPFLAETMRIEPAYRSRAIVALSVLNDMNADDELLRLLDEPSRETRYGAFRALHMRSVQNAQVRGRLLNKQFYLHVLSNNGPDMVHISTTRRPEIVVFGNDVRLRSSIRLPLDNYLVIKSVGGDRVEVSRFTPNVPPRSVRCPNRLEDVIETVATLGAGYSTVVQMLQSMKQKNYLDADVVFDAVPDVGRTPNLQDADFPDRGDEFESSEIDPLGASELSPSSDGEILPAKHAINI